jgi:hypothetical protein
VQHVVKVAISPVRTKQKRAPFADSPHTNRGARRALRLTSSRLSSRRYFLISQLNIHDAP